LDTTALYQLGLGLHETLRFLNEKRPDLAAFESWILAHSGGQIDPRKVAAVNDAVRRARAGQSSAVLADDFQPVWNDTELRQWNDNGYLILREAVSSAACAAAARAIWDYLAMDPDVPATWNGDQGFEGIFVTLTQHPALNENRASPRICRAFAQLLGTDDLIVTVDRAGFNPPVQPSSPFRGAGLHWDTSLLPPIPLQIQGILYLTDTLAEQGAFQCVPGFQNCIEAWLGALPAGANPRQQDLSVNAIPIPGKAGDMVLWHAALPHGASPNRGRLPRLVQYIAYYPTAAADLRPWL
jgi:hypothetical protein